jgi:hypothetical protein
MRKRLMPAMLLAIGLAVVSAAFAYPALSTPTTPTASINARMKTLESKVRSLQAKVNATANSHAQTRAAFVAHASCLKKVLPMTQYGGYLYTPDHGLTIGEDTALDMTVSGSSVGAYIQTVDPACVNNAAMDLKVFRLTKVSR